MTDVSEDLRAWARGMYALEAAVELLTRWSSGRFAASGYPWIQPTTEGRHDWWLDAESITDVALAPYSGGEQRILRIVASLAGGAPVHLDDVLSGNDRDATALVLAAVAHAAGSHDYPNIVVDQEAGVARNLGRFPTLYEWPSRD